MVDIPNNNTTTATVAVGGSFIGEIEVDGDRDWIAVTLVAGQSYSIALNGGGAGEIDDPLLNIRNSAGTSLFTNDDGGPGLSSLVTFIAPASGTFYIDAGAFDGSSIDTGTYTVTVEESQPTSFLDSIDWGTQLNKTVIDVYFAEDGETFDGNTSLGWNAYEIEQAMLAFEQFSNVCNISFRVTQDASKAEFELVTTHSNQFLGFFGPPGTGRGSGVGVFANNGSGWDENGNGGLEQGGYGFITLIHEFGHGMGLAHPHDNGGSSTVWEGVTSAFDSYGTFDLNQGIYTAMSYNDGWQLNPDGMPPNVLGGYEGTMMAFDIAVLQAKYGANAEFHDGADTYTLRDENGIGTYYSCLWDTGGIDAINYVGAADAVIDLRAAHLGYAEGSGGFISFASGIFGGFTIANGVVIENAHGGGGADQLIGNDVANTLLGGGGKDVIVGGLGRDIMNGNGGADDFVYLSALDSKGQITLRDHINGFQTRIDQIDLSSIDGQSGGTGDDAFLWIGLKKFHGVEGELRWSKTDDGVLILGDRDGNAHADFSILLANIDLIAKIDVLL